MVTGRAECRKRAAEKMNEQERRKARPRRRKERKGRSKEESSRYLWAIKIVKKNIRKH